MKGWRSLCVTAACMARPGPSYAHRRVTRIAEPAICDRPLQCPVEYRGEVGNLQGSRTNCFVRGPCARSAGGGGFLAACI